MLILKIGGGREINIDGVAADVAAVQGPVLIVHGANAWRDELAGKLGIEKRVITSASGYDSVFSDESAIDLLMMAYAGLRNKRIVEAMLRRDVRAIGLSGLDGCIVRARRNPGIRSLENGKVLIRRDFSGKPKEVNETLLRMLLDGGYVPVLTMPLADEKGAAVNSENDDVVAVLHAALHATTIVQLIEAPGLLRSADEPGSMVSSLTPSELSRWEESSSGRIKRKLHAISKVFASGPARLVIADGRTEHPLADALQGKGTVIE
jgi:acetylglutamate/LysW-gamma-L-alpha-aminoadipate kinase